jgi:hypothetical protein
MSFWWSVCMVMKNVLWSLLSGCSHENGNHRRYYAPLAPGESWSMCMIIFITSMQWQSTNLTMQNYHGSASIQLVVNTPSSLGWTIHSTWKVSYGPPWAHYLGGQQDRLLGGPLGLLDCATRHLMAWSARTTVEEYSDRKLCMLGCM